MLMDEIFDNCYYYYCRYHHLFLLGVGLRGPGSFGHIARHIASTDNRISENPRVNLPTFRKQLNENRTLGGIKPVNLESIF